MKKSKILIPALSIASVGAIVTPMVTSCKNTYSLSHNFYDDEGKFAEYKATKTPVTAEVKTGDDEAVAKLYIDAVNNDPSIFADDYLSSVSAFFKKTTNASPNGLNVTVSNPTASTDSSITSGGLVKLSYSAKYDLSFTANLGLSMLLSVDYVNVPYNVDLNTGTTPEPGIQPMEFCDGLEEVFEEYANLAVAIEDLEQIKDVQELAKATAAVLQTYMLIQAEVDTIGLMFDMLQSKFYVNYTISSVTNETQSETVRIPVENGAQLKELISMIVMSYQKSSNQAFLSTIVKLVMLPIASNYLSKVTQKSE